MHFEGSVRRFAQADTKGIKSTTKPAALKAAKQNLSFAAKIKTKIQNTSSFFKVSLKTNNKALALALVAQKEKSRLLETETVLLRKEVQALCFDLAHRRHMHNQLVTLLRDHQARALNSLVAAVDLLSSEDVSIGATEEINEKSPPDPEDAIVKPGSKVCRVPVPSAQIADTACPSPKKPTEESSGSPRDRPKSPSVEIDAQPSTATLLSVQASIGSACNEKVTETAESIPSLTEEIPRPSTGLRLQLDNWSRIYSDTPLESEPVPTSLAVNSVSTVEPVAELALLEPGRLTISPKGESAHPERTSLFETEMEITLGVTAAEIVTVGTKPRKSRKEGVAKSRKQESTQAVGSHSQGKEARKTKKMKKSSSVHGEETNSADAPPTQGRSMIPRPAPRLPPSPICPAQEKVEEDSVDANVDWFVARRNTHVTSRNAKHRRKNSIAPKPAGAVLEELNLRKTFIVSFENGHTKAGSINLLTDDSFSNAETCGSDDYFRNAETLGSNNFRNAETLGSNNYSRNAETCGSDGYFRNAETCGSDGYFRNAETCESDDYFRNSEKLGSGCNALEMPRDTDTREAEGLKGKHRKTYCISTSESGSAVSRKTYVIAHASKVGRPSAKCRRTKALPASVENEPTIKEHGVGDSGHAEESAVAETSVLKCQSGLPLDPQSGLLGKRKGPFSEGPPTPSADPAGNPGDLGGLVTEENPPWETPNPPSSVSRETFVISHTSKPGRVSVKSRRTKALPASVEIRPAVEAHAVRDPGHALEPAVDETSMLKCESGPPRDPQSGLAGKRKGAFLEGLPTPDEDPTRNPGDLDGPPMEENPPWETPNPPSAVTQEPEPKRCRKECSTQEGKKERKRRDDTCSQGKKRRKKRRSSGGHKERDLDADIPPLWGSGETRRPAPEPEPKELWAEQPERWGIITDCVTSRGKSSLRKPNIVSLDGCEGRNLVGSTVSTEPLEFPALEESEGSGKTVTSALASADSNCEENKENEVHPGTAVARSRVLNKSWSCEPDVPVSPEEAEAPARQGRPAANRKSSAVSDRHACRVPASVKGQRSRAPPSRRGSKWEKEAHTGEVHVGTGTPEGMRESLKWLIMGERPPWGLLEDTGTSFPEWDVPSERPTPSPLSKPMSGRVTAYEEQSDRAPESSPVVRALKSCTNTAVIMDPEHGRVRRRGKAAVSYKEPSINCKMRRGDKFSDTEFLNSPIFKDKNQKKKKKKVQELEIHTGHCFNDMD